MPNAEMDAEQLDHSCSAVGNANWYSHSGKQKLLKNLSIPLPYNITIALLSIYPRVVKTNVDTKNVCMNVYSNFINNTKPRNNPDVLQWVYG